MTTDGCAAKAIEHWAEIINTKDMAIPSFLIFSIYPTLKSSITNRGTGGLTCRTSLIKWAHGSKRRRTTFHKPRRTRDPLPQLRSTCIQKGSHQSRFTEHHFSRPEKDTCNDSDCIWSKPKGRTRTSGPQEYFDHFGFIRPRHGTGTYWSVKCHTTIYQPRSIQFQTWDV